MKTYTQISGEIGEFSDLPFWKKADAIDLAYVGYGLLIVTLVVVSYILGAFNLLPRDPQDLDLDLMMASPGTPGHLLGRYETAITYFTNLVDSFPRLVLILLVIAAFKPDIYYIMMVVGLTNVPVVASLVKGKILFLRQKNFIEADIALGVPTRIIILKHILWQNCRATLIIQATLGMAEAILMETSLSYLGFGVQEPTPSWGNMVQAGANYFMQGKFWPSTAPALAILFTILGFHLLGDGLNNLLEGKRNK
jgi:peptide/nickel transport system permease protein